MTRKLMSRRAALAGLGTSSLMLAGCDKLIANPSFLQMLESVENLTRGGQRLVLTSNAPLAREYQPSDITRNFKANGTVRPQARTMGAWR